MAELLAPSFHLKKLIMTKYFLITLKIMNYKYGIYVSIFRLKTVRKLKQPVIFK